MTKPNALEGELGFQPTSPGSLIRVTDVKTNQSFELYLDDGVVKYRGDADLDHGAKIFVDAIQGYLGDVIAAHTQKAVREARQVDPDNLFSVCDEFAQVRADEGPDYMWKWFSRNSERLLAALSGEPEVGDE